MRNLFLLVLTAMSIISCNHEQDQLTESVNPAQVKNISAAREADDPYKGDGVNPKILSTVDYPLNQQQTDGIAKAMGSGGCRTTDYFVGANTGTEWYHVVCSGTHYIIAYYPNTGTWGQPWIETAYDTGIWHGHKKSARETDQKAEMEEASKIVQESRNRYLATKDESSTSSRINCHTSFANSHQGHACVTVNGNLYNVGWSDLGMMGTVSYIMDEPVYTSVPVRSCSC